MRSKFPKRKRLVLYFTHIIFTILPFISGLNSRSGTIKIPLNVINYIFLIAQVSYMNDLYITEHCVRVFITRDFHLADFQVQQILNLGPTTLSEDFCGFIQTPPEK